MAEKEYVKRINRRLVHAGSIVDVYSDTMELPDGNTQEWDFVSHRTGAACVLPVLDDGRIVLVHQYRPALNRMTWEVPAGCRDSLDEPTIVSASRELTEETGYSSDDITFLISLKTTVAFCDEAIDVYLARNLKPGKQHLDEAEVIDVKAWTMEEALEEIYAGRIQDSKTVAAILAYETKVLLGDK
ncbi:MAG: NUDIX hydrolase [Lachnospiraceae bacterium]|nr:NUDIX hydrolase [Lachnospiraceae bacterium]